MALLRLVMAAMLCRHCTSHAAPQQVPGPVKHENNSQHLSGSGNIWSGRQFGPRGEGRKAEHQPSAYRCKPTLDAGKTKGSQGDVNTFCLFFAKCVAPISPGPSPQQMDPLHGKQRKNFLCAAVHVVHAVAHT